MKRLLQVFIRKGAIIQREAFELPEINVEDFDPIKHARVVYNYGSEKEDEFVRVWEQIAPTHEEAMVLKTARDIVTD